ncbi:MAG: tRNA (adenosine(37)-N6)-threonylcarbamoyltransferase complex transferase subunit TsaD, partial [Bacilli bacterium]
IDDEITFPAIALVASGGHTQLVYMEEHLSFKMIGTTLDDAVGECYDKIARVLNIGYPGGPYIDQLALKGQDLYPFKMPLDDESYNFSYSGLKSMVINTINTLKMKETPFNNEDIACSFQRAAIDILIKKSFKAIKEYKAQCFIIAGGVSANSYLRQEIIKQNNDIKVIMPKLKYCGDNAAMIAKLSYYYPLTAFKKDYSFKIEPSSNIEVL